MNSRKKMPEETGFVEDGRRYRLNDAHQLESADTFLSNDLAFIRINHRGNCDFGHTADGGPYFLQPDRTRWSENYRCVYVRDDATGEFWSAPYDPVQTEPESFEFAPGVADVLWRNVTDGIETTMRLVMPADETVELWTFTVRNVSRRKRRISLYPFFPIGWRGDLINICKWDEKAGGVVYEYFPYYVTVEGYAKNADLKNIVFAVADKKPTSYDAAMDVFKGGRRLHNPKALSQKRLKRSFATFEDGVAAFQYSLDLARGESREVNIVFGPAKDRREIARLKRKFLTKGGVEKALDGARKFLEKRRRIAIETPDNDFDSFVNYWLSKQTVWIGRTFRTSFSPCCRNAITDAMGLVYNDPERVRYWYLRIWAHQERGGWFKHGLPLAEGVTVSGINMIPHRDMNVWGPQAVYLYLVETGDESILDEVIPYDDDPAGGTLYEHISTGLDWLLGDRTKRGLCRVGQGDWCDPLNMAGHRMKGESVMLTETLVWALEIWAKVAERKGDRQRASRYRREAEKTRKVVNRFAWDGKWYVRGFTDEGRPFGSARNKEGKIWLNAQGWAIMTDIADEKRKASAIAAVEKHLQTPFGPTMNGPAYTRYYETIGKVTIKNPGIDENAGVYNSAVCWWALGLYHARRGDDAWRALRGMLTGAPGNPISQSGQLPLYVPNFFKGPAVGTRVGESSHFPGTGTAPWMYHTVMAGLFGMCAEFDGLRLDPQLPSKWRRAKVSRSFRGAKFEIEIKRTRRVKTTQVVLDGVKLDTNLVPVQKKGSRHHVQVLVPV